jgi:hypothetical protein
MFIALAAGLVLLGGNSAWADVQLDFNVPGGSGTFSWAGNGQPLVGANIGVASVLGTNTPSNSGTSLTITTGLLDVTTGNGSFNGTTIDFGAGPANDMTISGSILGNPNENLVTGTVQSATVMRLVGQNVLDVTFFTNTIAPDLAANYGVTTTPWAGAFHIDFTLPTGVSLGQPFTSAAAGGGSVVDTLVPEPSTMVIAGLGALGFLAYGLRIRMKR